MPVVAGVSDVRGPFSAPGADGVCGSGAAGQPSFTDSRGEPPRGSRRSSACPRGLDPPPEGRMPQPASACKGDSWPGLPACGPVPGGLQWGQLDGHLCTPGAPGVSLWPGTSCAPSRVKPTLHAASSEALGCVLRCVSPDALPDTPCRN